MMLKLRFPPGWNLYLILSSRATVEKMNHPWKWGIMQGKTNVCGREKRLI
jgi:hypothetical protein